MGLTLQVLAFEREAPCTLHPAPRTLHPAPCTLQVLEFEREAARGAAKTIQDLQRENATLKYALHRQ